MRDRDFFMGCGLMGVLLGYLLRDLPPHVNFVACMLGWCIFMFWRLALDVRQLRKERNGNTH